MSPPHLCVLRKSVGVRATVDSSLCRIAQLPCNGFVVNHFDAKDLAELV